MLLTTATSSLEELEDQLLTLPEGKRTRLANTLLDSLPIPEGILEEGYA